MFNMNSSLYICSLVRVLTRGRRGAGDHPALATTLWFRSGLDYSKNYNNTGEANFHTEGAIRHYYLG